MLASATYALVTWRSLWNGGKYMYMFVPTPIVYVHVYLCMYVCMYMFVFNRLATKVFVGKLLAMG